MGESIFESGGGGYVFLTYVRTYVRIGPIYAHYMYTVHIHTHIIMYLRSVSI